MLANATSEQQAATQDSNCIMEHKALTWHEGLKYNQT